jgi:hypothetical protein
MPTIIPGIADPHWTERKPSSRKDTNFLATQERKIDDLFKLSEKITVGDQVGAAAIVIAGDLFHQPKGPSISRKLDRMILRKFRSRPCPVAVIPGNHDMERWRVESTEDHPYGNLKAAGFITELIWPNYLVVGNSPPVVIIGKEFVKEGPLGWLNFLRESRALIEIKKKVSEKFNCKAQCLAMSHCWWGPVDTINRGEPVVGHLQLRGTGINVMIYGHPHTYDGVVTVQDDEHQCSVAGPGAFIRGTLAEHDVHRKPMISVMIFNSDGTHEVKMVPVPHEAPEQVFDEAGHKRKKQEEEVQARFVQELKDMNLEQDTPENLLKKAEDGGTPLGVVLRSRQYLVKAKAEK